MNILLYIYILNLLLILHSVKMDNIHSYDKIECNMILSSNSIIFFALWTEALSC